MGSPHKNGAMPFLGVEIWEIFYLNDISARVVFAAMLLLGFLNFKRFKSDVTIEG